MMKLSHFALTTAVVGGLTIATAGELLAASVPSNTVAIRQAVPAGVTDVRCGEFVGACGPYWGYSRGYQAYPGYGWGYSGYNWGYQPYSYSGYPAYSYRSYRYW
jgi:hypothetical protein